MKKLLINAIAIAGMATLAACQAGPQRGTEVTRFHLDQPVPAQPINLEPADPDDANSLEFQTYAGFVANELSQIGFEGTSLIEAEMIAVIDVTRGSRIEAAQRSPFSLGIGGGTYGRNVGVGVGTSVPVGGSGGGEINVTQLDVKLKRRSDGTIVWEGRAIRENRPGDEDPRTVMQYLASALFQGFPGQSGETIIVE